LSSRSIFLVQQPTIYYYRPATAHHAVFPLKTRALNTIAIGGATFEFDIIIIITISTNAIMNPLCLAAWFVGIHSDRWPVNGDWRCPGRNNVDAFYRNKTVVSKRFTLRVIYLFGKSVVANNPIQRNNTLHTAVVI